MTAFILMGVAGSGKSTIGQLVAKKLRLPFIEGDDFHPAANIAKMAAGVPLDDDDRVPWIDALSAALNAQASPHEVVACSALSNFVRDRLRESLTRGVYFIHLRASAAVLSERLEQRQHFMRKGMLASQLAALEAPKDAAIIDTERSLDIVVDDVCERISRLIAAHSS